MIPSVNRFMARGVREVDLIDRSFRRFTTPRLTPYVEMEFAMPPRRRGPRSARSPPCSTTRAPALLPRPSPFAAADDAS
jgi:hypothetical protein